MYLLISVLIIVVCIFMVLIVLVQNSKGGGLASNFAGSNQIMGVRKTADFLEKTTWGLAGFLLFLAVISSAFIPKDEVVKQSAIQEQVERAADPSAVPNFPTTAPEKTEKAPATTPTTK